MKRMEQNKTVAVIGGGASGLAAAVEAGRSIAAHGGGARVVLYERNPRLGKKLLLTGNGRCNLTNHALNGAAYNTPDALGVIAQTGGWQGTVAFFASMGLLCTQDAEGRVYPRSFQAASVLDVLRGELERLGVKVRDAYTVDAICKSGSGYIVNGAEYANRVIIACGGAAYPKTGSDGSGFSLLKQLGCQVNKPFPALTALVSGDKVFKSLKGVRAQAAAALTVAGQSCASRRGEIQFTEYGLSGIVIMQLSRLASAHFAEGGADVQAVLDLVPELDDNHFLAYLCQRAEQNPGLPARELLAGALPKALGLALLRRAGIATEEGLSCGVVLSRGLLQPLVAQVKHFCVRIDGVRGFAQAQVTAGGVSLTQLKQTMESRRCPGVYVCGESVDVDGDCGGYNLEWAFSSGRVAGRCAAQSVLEEESI